MFTQLRLAFSLAEKYHYKSIGPALKFSVPLEKLPGKLKLGMAPEEPLSSHIRQNTCYSFSNINQQLLNNLQSPLATTLVCNPWVHTFHHLTSWTEPALGMENRKDSRAKGPQCDIEEGWEPRRAWERLSRVLPIDQERKEEKNYEEIQVTYSHP